MDPEALFRRLTDNRHASKFFRVNREWAQKEAQRTSFYHCLEDLLMSEQEAVLAVIEEVDHLSPEPAECARLIETEAQAYLEAYDADLVGIIALGRERPGHALSSLITERAKGLHTFGEFLMNSLGIAHSYWLYLKKHNHPAIEAEMRMHWQIRTLSVLGSSSDLMDSPSASLTI